MVDIVGKVEFEVGTDVVGIGMAVVGFDNCTDSFASIVALEVGTDVVGIDMSVVDIGVAVLDMAVLDMGMVEVDTESVQVLVFQLCLCSSFEPYNS